LKSTSVADVVMWDVDVGVRLLERGKPRQQPFGGQRRQCGDGQHMVVVFAQHPVGREPQIIERGADPGQVVPGFRRQGERAVLPDEQAYPKFLFETLDLMADRGLRDVELGCRLREAQMPGGGLEGAQSIERRQPGGHFPHPIHEFYFMRSGTKCRLSNARITPILNTTD